MGLRKERRLNLKNNCEDDITVNFEYGDTDLKTILLNELEQYCEKEIIKSQNTLHSNSSNV